MLESIPLREQMNPLKTLRLEPTISDRCLFKPMRNGKIILVTNNFLTALNDEDSIKPLTSRLKSHSKQEI